MYCCRLIQPVKRYKNWYMMWYLEQDKFCREHIFSDWCIIFEQSVRHPVLVSLAVIHHPPDTFHVELVCASAHIFVRTLIFTIVRAIIFSNPMHDCMHNRTNDLFGRSRVRTPGLAHDLFCGSRVRFPDLAAWSFCGSRVRFPDPITCFRPVVSMAYVTRP